jgi:hypothetical protein
MSTLRVNSISSNASSTSAISLDSGGISTFNWTYGLLGAPGNQTNASTSFIKITLNTGGLSNNVTLDTNNSRLTIQRSGKYLCQGQITWGANASGGAWTPVIMVYKNGSQLLQAQWLHEVYNAGYNRTISIDRIVDLSGGDYLELWWNQNQGNTTTFNPNTHLQVIYLGQ